MNTPLITLTTDFGTADPYVGVMKGVILGINPLASIVDISHAIEPQSVLEGAFIIGNSHGFFSRGTIHVVVVDPGVGASRSALLLVTPSASFLSPDNGILSYVLEGGPAREPEISDSSQTPAQGAGARRLPLPEGYRAYSLTNREFWLHPVSSTFHGRDIFAPVAAHLSLGVPPHRLGEEVRQITWLPIQRTYWEGDTLMGHVVHIDRFGNLITNVRADLLPSQDSLTVEVKGHQIAGLSPSYAEGGPLLAIIGSHGNLEVSVKNGSASEELGASVGDPVRVATLDQATTI